MYWLTAINVSKETYFEKLQINDNVKISNGFDMFSAKVIQINQYSIECSIEPFLNKIMIHKYENIDGGKSEEYEAIMKLLYQFTDSFRKLDKLDMMLNNLAKTKPEYIDQIFHDLQLIQNVN
uniref:Uncharacterized protein n=1 Tax=viral metagenome TaxID=1070528 RepID=A0A6C0F6J9_9ZZZZ|tara:strand:- start:1527 stop:1892 length:366 start_codon:yes stop_codon:yes gene_type:complete